MPQNNNIQVVYLEMHLGNAPSFAIKADEDPTATSSQCAYSCSGTNASGDVALLKQVLSKIQRGYNVTPKMSLCINGNGWEIVNDLQCP